MTTRTGDYYERPITSDRADILPRVVALEGVTVVEALARGYATLAAVAAAYYGGDMDRARRAIYERRAA